MTIRTDYKLHFLAGGMIAALSWSFGWWWSLAVTALAAGGKEAHDAITKKGTPEAGDFWATVSGFGAVAIVELIKTTLCAILTEL